MYAFVLLCVSFVWYAFVFSFVGGGMKDGGRERPLCLYVRVALFRMESFLGVVLYVGGRRERGGTTQTARHMR